MSFCRNNASETRASVSGDCSAIFRKAAFGQSAFSVEPQINGTQFLLISENAPASVTVKHGSRQTNHMITDLNFCMESAVFQ